MRCVRKPRKPAFLLPVNRFGRRPWTFSSNSVHSVSLSGFIYAHTDRQTHRFGSRPSYRRLCFLWNKQFLCRHTMDAFCSSRRDFLLPSPRGLITQTDEEFFHAYWDRSSFNSKWVTIHLPYPMNENGKNLFPISCKHPSSSEPLPNLLLASRGCPRKFAFPNKQLEFICSRILISYSDSWPTPCTLLD